MPTLVLGTLAWHTCLAHLFGTYLQVTLTPSTSLCIQPHPVHDALVFQSVPQMQQHLASFGYTGGACLLLVRQRPSCSRRVAFWLCR